MARTVVAGEAPVAVWLAFLRDRSFLDSASLSDLAGDEFQATRGDRVEEDPNRQTCRSFRVIP